MKTRMGFVSNSSSTSFCLIGAYIDEDEIKDALKPEFTEAYLKAKDDYDVNEFFGEHGLVARYGEECSNVVGTDLEELDQDKSINQLKKEVTDRLGKIFKQPYETHLYYDSSYDG